MNLGTRRIVSAVLLILTLCFTSLPTRAACPDISGTWTATEVVDLVYNIIQQPEQRAHQEGSGPVNLAQVGCNVSYYQDMPDGRGGTYRAVRSGTIEGNVVTLTGIGMVPQPNVTFRKNEMRMVGTIDGNQIHCVTSVDVVFYISGYPELGNSTVRGSGTAEFVSDRLPPLTIVTSSPLPGGYVGVPYSQSLQVSGGTAPYTWTVDSGNLPTGLSLSGDGVISGTPAVATTANFTVRVANGSRQYGTKAFSLTIGGLQTLTVTANPGGSVSGGGAYPVGSQQQISATAATCFVFTGWNDGNTNNPRTVTVPVGGAGYTANFENILQGSVFTYQPSPAKMYAVFSPKRDLSLAEAAVVCGVDHFNWIQHITHVPAHWSVSRVIWGFPTEVTPPLLDPIDAGGPFDYYKVTSSALDPSVLPLIYAGSSKEAAWDNQPFYWSEPAERQSFEQPRTLAFYDTPATPLPYLPENGDFLQFETQLVGVYADGTHTSWNGIGTGFTWKSNTRVNEKERYVDGNASLIGFFKLVDETEAPEIVSGGIFDVVVDLPFTVTTGANPANAGTASGAGVYNGGTEATVSATPYAGYVFANWTEGGAVVSSSSNYTFTVTGPRTLTANFLLACAINASASPVGGGMVTGGGTYNAGDQVTLVATNSGCYQFVNWKEGATIVSTSPVYSFVATGSRTLVASFAPLSIQITPSSFPPTGGAVTGGGVKLCGETATVIAKPAAGFAFAGWTQGGTVVSTLPTYTFQAGANVSLVANFSDIQPPTLTLTAPVAGQRWSNVVFTIKGTARDNLGVAEVRWQINGEGWRAATTLDGWTNWSAVANLSSISNFVQAYAVDTTGNCSTTNGRSITHVLSDRLGIVFTGPGTLSPNLSNSVLELGKTFRLTAKPAAGYVFSNWVDNAGQVLSAAPALDFTMRSNLVLTANIITNPFAPAAGTYAGLFYNDNNPITISNSGYFSAKVTSGGKLTATLKQGAVSYKLSGQLSLGGQWQTNAIKGAPGLTVSLQMGLDAGDQITGQIGNQFWSADIRADRVIYSTTRPAPQAGSYTLVLPGLDDPLNLPAGHGAAAVNVSPAGLVKVSGTLGDGTAITASTSVSKHGHWPLYATAYGNAGFILGWLTFTNDAATSSDLAGVVSWVKPRQPGTMVYPNGFNWPYDNSINNAFGSAFANRVPLPGWSNGVLILADGNLASAITNGVGISVGNQATGTNGLKLTFTTTGPKAGLFTGSVTDPATKTVKAIKGALYQKLNTGYGSFLGTNQSGSVLLQAQ